MGRAARFDEPDSWHHVMNRGIARRTLFETESDIRFFLSRVAKEVRVGRLEVHAFCVLTTHFHLLVRSPRAELSLALQRVQNEYVRRFNRSRRRDGPLMRGRFRSRLVRSLRYRATLVRYIDENAVVAGLVANPLLYVHGSARRHVERCGSPWLERSWIREFISQSIKVKTTPETDYSNVFGDPLSPNLRRLICRRLDAGPTGEDPLDELFDASAPNVEAWMRRKALLADGTKPGFPMVDPESVQEVLERESAIHPTWAVKAGRRVVDAWVLAKVALLRELCATTLHEAAQRCERSIQGAGDLCRLHRRLLLCDDEYAARIAILAQSVLQACHGPATRGKT